MQQFPLARRDARTRTIRHALGAAAMLIAAACARETTAPEKPILPVDPPVSPAVQAAAWRFDVNTSKHTIKITPPAPRVSGASGLSLSADDGVAYSLVGSDVISLSTSNYTASGVGSGGAPAGKVLVTFDLAITNLLTSVDLITPTFPTPPTGVTGIQAFAFSTNVTTTSGGVTSSGNQIIIDLPNTGQVAPSADFDGNPWNFFNDTGCPAGSNDCYRYENYPIPLAAGGTTPGQRIGFVIDPTVSNFSAKVIVAADLQNSGPAISRTVSGTVNSNIGPLTGGTVSVSGAGSASPSGGAYSVLNVGAGPHSVSYAPPAGSGCSVPSPQSITVSSGSPSPIVVDFAVTGCTAPPSTGTVNGAINFAAGSGTPSLVGVVVTLTPSAAGTSPVTANPSAGGAYSSSAVTVGTGGGAGAGNISFASLPAGCTFVGPSTSSWTGLTIGGTVSAAAVTITCPQANYPLTYTWGTPSAGSITLTVSINMNAQNSPLNHGASPDLIGAFQGTVTYGTRVSAPVCTGQTGFTGVFNTAGSSVTAVLTNLSGAGGTVVVYSCVFTYSAAGTTTLSGSGHLLSDETGADDFTARTTITFAPIP
jgi:hypothetical protein